MNTSANRHHVSARFLLALALTASTAGCTHEYQITPVYQPALAQLPARPICTRGESLAVSVSDGPGQSLDAGSVQAGIHTFNHQFTRDPAAALAGGLTAVLREGNCAAASPANAALSVVVVRMKAHGEACGFISCEGVAEATVAVELRDATGRVLLVHTVSTDVKDDCGMMFCSDEETSGFASRALSETIGKMIPGIRGALAKRPAAESPVAMR